MTHERGSDPGALALLAFGALCVSFAAVFVKLVDPEALGPTAIGFWRALSGSVVLFMWAAVGGKALRMPPVVLRFSLLAGFVFFLDLYFWHRSIIYAGAGMATILANTQVFVAAVLAAFVFKERLSVAFFAAAVTAVAGIALLVGVGSDIAFGSIYLAGIVFGLLTGLVYGIYLVIMKRIGQEEKRPHFLTIMAWTSLFTAVFLGLATALESSAIVPPDAYHWVVLVSLGLVAQALGWWAITSALPRLATSRSSLGLLLQPVLTTVWGYLFFSEYLTPLQIVGAAITLAAIYYGSVRRMAPTGRAA
jgi:drug/metabolite transporter (DMT)-like permease